MDLRICYMDFKQFFFLAKKEYCLKSIYLKRTILFYIAYSYTNTFLVSSTKIFSLFIENIYIVIPFSKTHA